ncbi:MAG TPA: FeoB-associated Cys-rich membrane protein [Clostridia bacterium]|nr:FeoB-associated Cys-rich membrane protein [Clostridiales bacterium]MDD6720667.1 FeoB-associated Cys-rich membrane protein [Clostridiales bacterium]HZK44912.1 FeoB-associated Cys-rich membrane protein [Clostridia bacterium]
MAVTALIIARLVRQKKQGKSCCGCNCANCAMRGSCQSQQTETH